MTVLAIAAWIFMNNLPQHDCGPTPIAIGKYLWLQMIGFLGTAVGVLLLVFLPFPGPELIRIFLVLIAAVVATMLGMKFMTPKTIQEPLNKQFAIFKNKHNWVMTWLYVMTFGSFQYHIGHYTIAKQDQHEGSDYFCDIWGHLFRFFEVVKIGWKILIFECFKLLQKD